MSTDRSLSTEGLEPARDGTDVPQRTPGVLVVDDDPMLLSLLRLVCERRGFRVWTSDSGGQAVLLYREHRPQVDVVLLDVRMPGLDGPATLAELRRINTGVRACFMSGNTGDYSLDDLQSTGALAFFPKPFQIQDLAEKLWRLARPDRRQSA